MPRGAGRGIMEQMVLRRGKVVHGARGGFTLIELLVVVMVTGLLSGFFILYGRAGRQRIALTVETAKMAQTIFRAKERALATYTDPDPLKRACGYGVHADSSSRTYSLFGYQAADCRALASIDAANFVLVETSALASGMSFGSGADRLDDVLFVPPDPTTLLWGGGAPLSSSGNFYLSTADGGMQARISVNSAGQINF